RAAHVLTTARRRVARAGIVIGTRALHALHLFDRAHCRGRRALSVRCATGGKLSTAVLIHRMRGAILRVEGIVEDAAATANNADRDAHDQYERRSIGHLSWLPAFCQGPHQKALVQPTTAPPCITLIVGALALGPFHNRYAPAPIAA